MRSLWLLVQNGSGEGHKSQETRNSYHSSGAMWLMKRTARGGGSGGKEKRVSVNKPFLETYYVQELQIQRL